MRNNVSKPLDRACDYRSLSVVARKITGARWSGPRFLASGSGPETLLQPRE